MVLVVPIDSAAPKGRLILPQQQTIRDILDAGAIAVVAKDTELQVTLEKLGTQPKMVITDSQVFSEVSRKVPLDIPLTSFSILMARYKGDLQTVVEGAYMLNHLRDGDKVLIAEGCTHHRQCGDIGIQPGEGTGAHSLAGQGPQAGVPAAGESRHPHEIHAGFEFYA